MAATSIQRGFYSFLEENHHHDVWRLVVLLCVFAAAIALSWFFFGRSEKVDMTQQNTDTLTARRALLMQTNSSANLSAAEIKARQAVLGSSNSSAQPTIDEIERRMRLIE